MTDTLAGWGWRGGLLMTESLLLPGGGLITCSNSVDHGSCYQPPTVLLLATLLAALSYPGLSKPTPSLQPSPMSGAAVIFMDDELLNKHSCIIVT